MDGKRPVAVAQVEALDHPDEPEPVVEVEVGEEHVGEVAQPDRAQQLALRPLAAVDEDPIPAAPDQQRGQPTPRAGHGSGGAGEEDGEVHARKR